jgi:hypothetical protein
MSKFHVQSDQDQTLQFEDAAGTVKSVQWYEDESGTICFDPTGWTSEECDFIKNHIEKEQNHSLGTGFGFGG